MKKYKVFGCMVLVFTCCSWLNPGFAQEPDSQKVRKPLVAILDFQASSGLSLPVAVTLTDVFRNAVIRTKMFNVLERSDMKSILEEQAFSLTGVCNSAECAVEVGKLLSAEKIILGSIGKIGGKYYSTVRIVDVTKGNIENSADEKFDADAETIFEVYDRMAKKLAGIYKESKTWWYVGGAVAAGVGVAAYFILSGDEKTDVRPEIGSPPGNPQIP